MGPWEQATASQRRIMSLDKLQAAGKGDVLVYAPYYPKSKQKVLPFAISLYQQGSLEGERQVEDGDGVPFVATWFVSKLPSEMTRCRVQFDGQADLSYEFTLANNEFVSFLIELLIHYNKNRVVDFTSAFYRRLLKFAEPA